MLQELEEGIVSNSENLEKLLEKASHLCLYSLAQCVKQMALEGQQYVTTACVFSSLAKLDLRCP